MGKRLAYIDFLKGASISLVVFYHCSLFLQVNGFQDNAVGHVMNALSLVRMPVFFFVSGYLSTNLVNRPWPEVLGGRVLTFLWLFGLWTVLRYLYFGYLVENKLNPDDAFGLSAFVMSYINPDTQLWFIWALAIYTIVAKLTINLSKWLVVGGAFVVSALTYYSVIETYSNQQTYLLWYSLFFFTALRFKREIIGLIERRSVLALASSFALMLAFVVLAKLFDVRISLLRMPLSIAATVATIFAAASLCRAGPVNDIVARIGAMSLPIYLAHTFFIAALANAAAMVAQPSAVTTVSLLFIIALASIALSILLYRAARSLGIRGLYDLPRPQATPALPLPADRPDRCPSTLRDEAGHGRGEWWGRGPPK
ncbi:MAG TPA: acyltransferase family protein [Xanthobacteraceae bacterium]|nr:acyltransferase family protein [Xanthobacteraceae bacterium]